MGIEIEKEFLTVEKQPKAKAIIVKKCDKNTNTTTNGSGDSRSPNKIVVQQQQGNHSHVVHPMSSGPVNCLLAVDHVVRATTDCGAPGKISLSPSPSFNVNCDDDKNVLLEQLQNTRHLFVREYKKPLKWPMQGGKKFQVLNSGGNCIYYGAETSSFINKLLCFRGLCPFNISLYSVNREPVMEIQGRYGLFETSLTVRDSENQLIGRIKKMNRLCSQAFSVMAWDGNEILKIIGPDGSNCCCLFADCGNEDFDVNLADGTTSIGRISSEWEYALEDLCGVFVPMKLDDKTMALLLGVVFLIDFSYYQRRRDASCFGKCFLNILCFALFMLLLYFIAKK